jgi:hypothetical protein
VTAGLLDEAGGFAGITPVGAGPILLFSVTLHADALGDVTFAGNAADLIPGHDTLVYGSNNLVTSDLVLYGQTVLHVVTSADPTAALAHPADGATVPQPQINVNERYIDVTFADISGRGLDASTITDAAPEFALSGGAAAGVTFSDTPTVVSGTTYRYALTAGNFGVGQVTVTFAAGSFADNGGNTNAQSVEHFSVLQPDAEAPTAHLAAPTNGQNIGDTVINGRHYIDITFADTGGSGLDVSTITDAGAEFTLGGAGVGTASVTGAGVLVSGTTYRYSFTGSFVPGAVTVTFLAGSVTDGVGNPLAASTESFSVFLTDSAPPTAALANPANGASINDIVLNPRGWIDVTFTDAGGAGLDTSTITDAGQEFTVSGDGAGTAVVNGAATLVSGTTLQQSQASAEGNAGIARPARLASKR